MTQKLRSTEKIHFNESFRTLARYLIFFNKNIKDKKIGDDSILTWLCIYKSFDLFLPNFRNKQFFNDTIFIDMYKNLKFELRKSIYLLGIEQTSIMQNYAKALYLNGGLKGNEKINTELELILKYINGDKIKIENRRKKLSSSETTILFESINSKDVTTDTIKKLFSLKLTFASSVSKNLIELVIITEDIDFLNKEELTYFLNILNEEIEKKIFYQLYYTGKVSKISENEYFDEDEDMNLEKTTNLGLFIEILNKSKYKSVFKKIFPVIAEHIKYPELNSKEITENELWGNREEESSDFIF